MQKLIILIISSCSSDEQPGSQIANEQVVCNDSCEESFSESLFHGYWDELEITYNINKSNLPNEISDTQFESAVRIAVGEWESLGVRVGTEQFTFREINDPNSADLIFQFLDFQEIRNRYDQFEALGGFSSIRENAPRNNSVFAFAFGPISERFPERIEINTPNAEQADFVRSMGLIPEKLRAYLYLNNQIDLLTETGDFLAQRNWKYSEQVLRCDNESVDLIQVLIHEIGHKTHSSNRNSVMFSCPSYDDLDNSIRDILNEDIRILKSIYPRENGGLIKDIQVDEIRPNKIYIKDGNPIVEVRGLSLPFDMEAWIGNSRLQNLTSDVDGSAFRFFQIEDVSILDGFGSQNFSVFQNQGMEIPLLDTEISVVYEDGFVGYARDNGVREVSFRNNNEEITIFNESITVSGLGSGSFNSTTLEYTFFSAGGNLYTYDILEGSRSFVTSLSEAVTGLRYLSDGRLIGVHRDCLVEVDPSNGRTSFLSAQFDFAGKDLGFGSILNEDENIYIFSSGQDLYVFNYENQNVDIVPFQSGMRYAFYEENEGKYFGIFENRIHEINIQNGNINSVSGEIIREQGHLGNGYFYNSTEQLLCYPHQNTIQVIDIGDRSFEEEIILDNMYFFVAPLF